MSYYVFFACAIQIQLRLWLRNNIETFEAKLKMSIVKPYKLRNSSQSLCKIIFLLILHFSTDTWNISSVSFNKVEDKHLKTNYEN